MNMDNLRLYYGLASPFLHVHIVEECKVIDYIKDITASTGLSVYVLDSFKCQTRSGFFEEIANALKFPDYFGHNWDALEECLSDIEWIINNGWVLVFLNADKLLNEGKANDFHTLAELLDSIGREWSQPRCYDSIHKIEARPFHSIFHANPKNEQILLEKFDKLESTGMVQISR